MALYTLCEDRECASNICLNGGTCHVDDTTRLFACRCPPGFSGSLCQEACTLECANGVCVKGAFGKEQCQCTQGIRFLYNFRVHRGSPQ
ncbi:EGF-like domain protein [Ancylostoma caninum]|uniref:EGF-like domain protein n=1 Tax=Ancylostoma caninum TaxID=29170 RepID=A0A368GAZ4_ANCCA|nr:EGF-like domain protein [Ancylostoma caninum]